MLTAGFIGGRQYLRLFCSPVKKKSQSQKNRLGMLSLGEVLVYLLLTLFDFDWDILLNRGPVGIDQFQVVNSLCMSCSLVLG